MPPASTTTQAPGPNEKQLVCTVQEAPAQGADAVSVPVNAGLSVGRNVFGADNVPQLCRAPAGIVHQGLGVADALDLLHSDSRR